MCISCRRVQSIVRIKKKELRRKKSIKPRKSKWVEMTNPTYNENRTGIPHSPEQRKHKIYCQKETKRNTNYEKNEIKTHRHRMYTYSNNRR